VKVYLAVAKILRRALRFARVSIDLATSHADTAGVAGEVCYSHVITPDRCAAPGTKRHATAIRRVTGNEEYSS
jgi:hypothetical protein